MSDEQEFDFQEEPQLQRNDDEMVDEEQGPYAHISNQTEQQRIDIFTTRERYYTLMHTEPDTKNVPKTLGNNFKKFMEKMRMLKRDLIQQPTKEMDEFLNKKQTGKQSNYIINDFKELFKNEICRQWFIYYIKNCAFLDLIHSNRIENAEEYIHFIEQYLAGAQQPQNFICNRNSNGKKTDQKKQKAQQKQTQQQQQVHPLNEEENFQNDCDNDGYSQNHLDEDFIDSNQQKIGSLMRKDSFEGENDEENEQFT